MHFVWYSVQTTWSTCSIMEILYIYWSHFQDNRSDQRSLLFDYDPSSGDRQLIAITRRSPHINKERDRLMSGVWWSIEEKVTLSLWQSDLLLNCRRLWRSIASNRCTWSLTHLHRNIALGKGTRRNRSMKKTLPDTFHYFAIIQIITPLNCIRVRLLHNQLR